MENIVIREAKLEDLQYLLKIIYQLSPSKDENNKEKLNQTFKKIIDNENHNLYVALTNGKIIGTGLLLIQLNLSHNGKPYSHIENVVVDESYRGKGIGIKITNHLIEKAKAKECYKVILNCEKSNALFYEKCGLKETGEVEMRKDF